MERRGRTPRPLVPAWPLRPVLFPGKTFSNGGMRHPKKEISPKGQKAAALCQKPVGSKAKPVEELEDSWKGKSKSSEVMKEAQLRSLKFVARAKGVVDEDYEVKLLLINRTGQNLSSGRVTRWCRLS